MKALRFIFSLCTAIGLIASNLLLVALPTPAYAMPFSCSGDIFQVQSGQLRIFDPIVSAYVDVGAPQGAYNAVGFNVRDNFAYGSQNNTIIRIAADGSITTLFTGNPDYNSFAGDVDDNNTLWLRDSTSRYVGVDLATGATTVLNVTGPVTGGSDIIVVNNGGTPFILAINGNRIGRININTGVSTVEDVTGLTTPGGYGAAWQDSTGRIFAFHNATGQIFEMSGVFGSSPSGVLVAQGDPSGNNDGFSCNQAPFPNLPPLAMDDSFTGPLNTNITGNVLVDNGNGVDEDPEGFGLSINTTPIAAPSNGTVTISPNGDFTYVPNNNFIGTDTFVYQINDPSGLADTATVTLTITGTIAFTVNKTQSGGPDPITTAGQVVDYEIELQNTGDIPLTGLTIDDTLPDGTGGTVTLQSGDTNSDGNLDTTEAFVYTISYTVTQDDIDNNTNLVNQVSVTTTETGATAQTSSASTPVSTNPSLVVTKVALPRVDVPVGTSVTYTYTVTNNGNVTLRNINLSDAHLGSGTPPIPDNEILITDTVPLNDSNDVGTNGIWDVLRPGDVVQFTAQYTVTQTDVDSQ